MPSDTTFTIRVTGTPGLEFHGSYIVIGPGLAESQRVHGRTPQDYIVSGRMVSTTFQKRFTDGTLRVEIIKHGEVVRSSETIAKYGVVVTVAASR